MDIDRIYQIMGSALKRVYGFYITRPLQRFNVDNRAEKVFEKQKSVPKVAPRHERTDQLFQQIIQNNPQFRKDLNDKREDLLKRLGSVRVVSKDIEISEEEMREMKEIRERVRSRLPQSREGTDYPIHAYTEPAFVPKGRVSLLKALDFIGKHSKDADKYDHKSIATQLDMNSEDVNNILNHFKPFFKEDKKERVADSASMLGLSKQQFSQITSFLKPMSDVNKKQIESSSPSDAQHPTESTNKDK